MRRTTRRELIVGRHRHRADRRRAARLGAADLRARAGIGPGASLTASPRASPAPTAVTFWSRLRTDRPRSGARLIVADRRGHATTSSPRPIVPTGRGVDGTLKARVGGLEPHTEYFYVWESGDRASRRSAARARRRRPARRRRCGSASPPASTTPTATSARTPNAAARADLDLYLFLGDYIYERGRPPDGLRCATTASTPSTSRTYRRKYRVYRADPGLRELHRAAPGRPHLGRPRGREQLLRQRRRRRRRRSASPATARRSSGCRAMAFPRDRYRDLQELSLGAMAELFLLDSASTARATTTACRARILGERADAVADRRPEGLAGARGRSSPTRSSMSDDPFGDGRARRPVGRLRRPTARGCWARSSAPGIRNVVFLTGDAHVFMCNLLASRLRRRSPTTRRARRRRVEYVGGSVTSPGPDQAARPRSGRRAPWNQQYNGVDHGYALLTLDADQLVTEYRRSDIVTSRRGATVAVRALHAARGHGPRDARGARAVDAPVSRRSSPGGRRPMQSGRCSTSTKPSATSSSTRGPTSTSRSRPRRSCACTAR